MSGWPSGVRGGFHVWASPVAGASHAMATMNPGSNKDRDNRFLISGPPRSDVARTVCLAADPRHHSGIRTFPPTPVRIDGISRIIRPMATRRQTLAIAAVLLISAITLTAFVVLRQDG